MQTAPRETILQMALGNCFKEAGRKISIYIYIYICDFGEGGIHTIEHIFFQKVSAYPMKFSASHEKQSSL